VDRGQQRAVDQRDADIGQRITGAGRYRRRQYRPAADRLRHDRRSIDDPDSTIGAGGSSACADAGTDACADTGTDTNPFAGSNTDANTGPDADTSARTESAAGTDAASSAASTDRQRQDRFTGRSLS